MLYDSTLSMTMNMLMLADTVNQVQLGLLHVLIRGSAFLLIRKKNVNESESSKSVDGIETKCLLAAGNECKHSRIGVFSLIRKKYAIKTRATPV